MKWKFGEEKKNNGLECIENKFYKILFELDV